MKHVVFFTLFALTPAVVHASRFQAIVHNADEEIVWVNEEVSDKNYTPAQIHEPTTEACFQLEDVPGKFNMFRKSYETLFVEKILPYLGQKKEVVTIIRISRKFEIYSPTCAIVVFKCAYDDKESSEET